MAANCPICGKDLSVGDHKMHSGDFLQLILDNVPAFVFWKDVNSVYLGCNQNYAEVVGLESPQQIVGKTDADFWPDHTEVESYQKDDRTVMKSGIPKYRYRERTTSKDGEHCWVETTKIPLKDKDGNIFGVMGIYVDVTEKMDKAEEDMISVSKLHDQLKEKLNGH